MNTELAIVPLLRPEQLAFTGLIALTNLEHSNLLNPAENETFTPNDLETYGNVRVEEIQGGPKILFCQKNDINNARIVCAGTFYWHVDAIYKNFQQTKIQKS